MSITIDWAALTTGPSGLALADSIRDFIHDKFQQVTLPRFIRSVQVHSFHFGDECPVVELKDISDPLPEFYEDEEDEDDEEEDLSPRAGDEVEAASTKQYPMKPPPLDTRLPNNLNLRSHLPFSPSQPPTALPDQITTPFLSRSNTPGVPIPGGTANFSYFHLPLHSAAGLSGTTTPLPWGEHYARPASPSRREAAVAPAPPPLSTTTASTTNPSSSKFPTFNKSTSNTQQPHYHHPKSPSNLLNNGGNTEDRTLDFQTTLHISYTGSLSLSLTAEILLDYPMPSFVGIPLKLQITGLSFDGVALLAYLRRSSNNKNHNSNISNKNNNHHSATNTHDHDHDNPDDNEAEGATTTTTEPQQKIHFCFLNRDDARATLGHDSPPSPSSSSKKDHDHTTSSSIDKEDEEDERGIGALLREIRVESEIGRSATNAHAQAQGQGQQQQQQQQQVLKNVGKVEKFVLEQARRIFEEEFVWPSFWTFLV